MPIIKHIAPITDILSESGVIDLAPKGKASKREALIDELEKNGINTSFVASTIANQFYSSDEVTKDKAIDRWLKLQKIITPDDVLQIPSVTINITGGYNDEAINPILTPRDIDVEYRVEK